MGTHCYANRDDFWRYLGDSGADELRTHDAFVRTILEGASRRVDTFCHRTGAGLVPSGFGPRTGVNLYDHDGRDTIDLDDDLLELTSLEVADTTGAAYVGWSPSDFYLWPYSGAPYREIIQPDVVGVKSFGRGLKVVRVTGRWGYEDVRSPLVAVTLAGWTAGATTLGVSDASEFAPGQTIWCGTEAIYVRDVVNASLLVTRGAHGTTAASHNTSVSLEQQEYNANVKMATLMLALRRWKQREVGLGGDYGGAGGPGTTSERAREVDILRAVVGDLAFAGDS